MHLLDDHVVLTPEDIHDCDFALVRRVAELRGLIPAHERSTFLTERRREVARELRGRVVRDFRCRYAQFAELDFPPPATLTGLRDQNDASVAELRALRAVAEGTFLHEPGPGVVLASRPAVALPGAVAEAVADRFASNADLARAGAHAVAINAASGYETGEVILHLNNDRRRTHAAGPLARVAGARLAHLAGLLQAALTRPDPWSWGEEDVFACGYCPQCRAGQGRDVQVVWGTNRALRNALHRAGLTTIEELAASDDQPVGVDRLTWQRQRQRAHLQLAEERTGVRTAAVHAPGALSALPEPDSGDVFFDFEGDPLWVEKNRFEWGLEFLFGYIEADSGSYTALWSESQPEEGRVFAKFVDYLLARKKKHPGMHVYHFAFYEPARMRNLARRHRYKQSQVAALLSDGTFVDLYEALKAGVSTSGTSYGLKALEPLYMGPRAEGVGDGGEAVEAFARQRTLRRAGKAEDADRLRAEIAAYNEEDCRSTWLLRDWLLSHRPPAVEAEAADLARAALGAQALESELLLAPLAEPPDDLGHVRLRTPGFDEPGIFYIATGSSADALGARHKEHELLGRWGSGSAFAEGAEALVAYADPGDASRLTPRRALITSVDLAGDEHRVTLRETTPAHDPATHALTPLFLDTRIPLRDPAELLRAAKRKRYTLFTGTGEEAARQWAAEASGAVVLPRAHYITLRQALAAAGEADHVVAVADPALAPPPPRRTEPADLAEAPLLTFLTGDFGAKVETHRAAGPDHCAPVEFHAVPHRGRRGESIEEAHAVAALVRDLLATSPLGEEDVLVTGASDAQTLLLARELAPWPGVRARPLTKIDADAQVAILSLGISTLADLPARARHTPLAAHVLAAARTRARERTLVVHGAHLLEQLPPRADMFGEVAAFAALRG